MLSSLKVLGETMTSSYLGRTLRTSRKSCWKKRWVRRRRWRRNNLGIHWNSLSTAGRGVISREGFKQAISGTAPLPTHLLTHIQSCISKTFHYLWYLSQHTAAQHTCPVPIRVCEFEAWLADRWGLWEGWESQSLSLQEKMAALVGVPRFL